MHCKKLSRSVGFEIAKSLLEIGQGGGEHLTVTGFMGVSKLLTNSLTGKNEAVDLALSSCLLGSQLRPRSVSFF
jgi:hypothetical protein